MQRVPFEEYLNAPVGRWTSGEGWLHFCAVAPTLVGGLAWGALGPTVVEQMLRCSSVTAEMVSEPHPALTDGRRTRAIEQASYRGFSDYILDYRARLSGRVVQMACVRPRGILGLIAEGFMRVVPAPCPIHVCTERGEGLRWLGCEAHTSMIDDIEGLASTKATGDFLSELREALNRQLVDGSIESAAKRLGTSVRSLQRRLRAEGTSFQRELGAARVRAAQRRMLESDLPLTKIAVEVGFGSAPHFSVVFRRHQGVSPSEWLEMRRAVRDNDRSSEPLPPPSASQKSDKR